MPSLHEKVCENISHLIGIAQFRNHEASMKKTVNGIHFLYLSNNNAINNDYIEVVKGFYNYVKNHKPFIAEHIKIYKLAKLISLLKNPPRAFPIGTYVRHKRKCYKDNSTSLSPDNITYENGIVDDYDYTVNQYQLYYDNGATVGWIPESDLSLV